MTGSHTGGRADGPFDREWWDGTVGRAIRMVWHAVGFYAAVISPIQQLATVLIVGVPPAVGPVPLPVAASVALATGLAVLLSALRPAVSSARTLAFGITAALLFEVAGVVLGRPRLAGRPLVAVDVALAAIGVLSLSAVVAFGIDTSNLRSGGSGS